MRVCILGLGLSSLTLAKALVNQNIYVDITSEKKIDKYDKSRTIGISMSNIKFFNSNIINVNKILWKLKKIEIFSENLKNEKIINFENNKKEIFSIIKNYKLFQILNKQLLKNKYFKKISFKESLIFSNKYNLIINMDNNNFVTKKFFNRKITKRYNSYAFTTLIKHKEVVNNIATQIFTKMGPLAFLPVSTKETSVVYSLYNSKENKIKNIKSLINYYNSKYKIKKIEDIKYFELKAINLRSYYFKNILAFGDLIHRVHPLAGQGFNMIIRDIKILLEIIVKKKDLGLPLDHSINKEFELTVRHKNFIFSNSIDLIHEFFNLERKSNSKILGKSVKILLNRTYINKIFTKIADKGIIF